MSSRDPWHPRMIRARARQSLAIDWARAGLPQSELAELLGCDRSGLSHAMKSKGIGTWQLRREGLAAGATRPPDNDPRWEAAKQPPRRTSHDSQ